MPLLKTAALAIAAALVAIPVAAQSTFAERGRIVDQWEARIRGACEAGRYDYLTYSWGRCIQRQRLAADVAAGSILRFQGDQHRLALVEACIKHGTTWKGFRRATDFEVVQECLDAEPDLYVRPR